MASLMGVVAAAPAGNGDGLDGQCMYACSPRQAARTTCARTRHLHPPIPRALGEHAHVGVSVLRSYGRRLGRSSRCRTDAGRRGQVVPTQAFLAAAGYHELPVRRACSSGGAGAHRRKLRAARRRGGGVRRAGDGGVAWQPSGRASAREPWKLLLPTIQIDPGHTSPRSNDRERQGWTVFHLPSTPRVRLRRSSSLSDAPGSAGSRSARSRTIPAGRRAIGVLRGAAAALPGLCRPACACVARDARARRRRRSGSGSGRRSSTRSPD